jgi:hypothetical protein
MPAPIPRWLCRLLAAGAVAARAQEVQQQAPDEPEAAPLVAAIFYSWYDAATGARLRSADGRDLLRHHFVEPSIVRPESVEWFEQELRDLADAGVDVLLAASVPAPAGAERWMPALLQALENRRGRLPRPVRAALLLDPALAAVEHAGGGEAGPAKVLDLTDARAEGDFLAPVDRFFATFPPELRASVGGRPLLVLGPDSGVGARPQDLLERIELRVAALAGAKPWLVVERSWGDSGRARWRAGSARAGPWLSEEVATLGPGYDGRGLEGERALVVPRENGLTYARAWQSTLAAAPRLVILESWNQMQDGSALCVAREHGTAYVDATSRCSELLRAGKRLAEPLPTRGGRALLAESYVEDRPLATADVARYAPDTEGGGIRIDPDSVDPAGPDGAARLSFERAPDGTVALVVAPRPGSARAVVRFTVSPDFVGLEGDEYDVEVHAEAGSRPVEVEICGAGERALLESRVPRVIRARVAALRHQLGIEAEGGPLLLQQLVLRRRSGALPNSRLGICDPEFLRSPGAQRLEAARELGAAWFRFEASLAALCAPDGSFAVEPVERAVKLVRDAGMEPVVALVDPPRRMAPVAAHPEEVAAAAAAIARRCGDSLRFLELFPGANRPGGLSRAPDPQGYVRVVRAAARAAHAANPRLAVALGGITGPDAAWLRIVEELREGCSYDALSLLADDEWGEVGGRTFAHQLGKMARELSAGPDADKPYFLEIGATTTSSPLLERERRALLAETLRAAWRRLERAPTPVHLLDEPELPRVKGLAPAHAAQLLEERGIEAVPRPLGPLIEELETGRVQTLLLSGGEIAPRELLSLLPPFLDAGGLLVTFGGAPFRLCAKEVAGGGFEIDEDARPGLELRDELRIALARFRPGVDPAPPARAWRSGLLAPGLADRFAPAPRDGALFTERTGQPRSESGWHRYEPLLSAYDGERRLGDAAALVAFTGPRRGALLLIGADAEDHGRSEEGQAEALRSGFGAGEAAGARAVFWRGLIDDPGAPGAGLLAADGRRRTACEAFAELARRESGPRK